MPVGQPNNLAYYYVTGPVHIYMRVLSTGVGFGRPPGVPGAGTPILFVGHTEDSPEPDFTPEYIPVFSSLSGLKVPDEEVFMGGNYQVAMDLTRFDYDVLTLLRQWPRYGRDEPPGTETYLSRGRLLFSQGDSFELWLKHSFYGTPNAAAYPNLKPGFYFPACRSASVLPRKLSRETKRANITITPKSVRQGVIGDTITYSEDPKWFVNLPPPG